MVRRTSAVATVSDTVAAADAILADVDLSGDPAEALAVLIGMSWRTLEQVGRPPAGQQCVPPDELRRALYRVRSRIAGVIEHGRAQGRFRSDGPTDWYVSATITLLHGAAADVAAGRLVSDQVGWVVATTVVQALSAGAPALPAGG